MAQHELLSMKTSARSLSMEMEPSDFGMKSAKRRGWFSNVLIARRRENNATMIELPVYFNMDTEEAVPTFHSSQGYQAPPEQKPPVQPFEARDQQPPVQPFEDSPNQENFLGSPPVPIPSNLIRGQSSMTRSSGGDSLEDFDETEWTPPDSSYGAAIPVMGWIPKNTRRTIEYSLIAILVAFLVYLIVATSIIITDTNHSSSNNATSSNSLTNRAGNMHMDGGLHLDDDLYIEAHPGSNYQTQQEDDDQLANDTDGQSRRHRLQEEYNNHDRNFDSDYFHYFEDDDRNTDDAYRDQRQFL